MLRLTLQERQEDAPLKHAAVIESSRSSAPLYADDLQHASAASLPFLQVRHPGKPWVSKAPIAKKDTPHP